MSELDELHRATGRLLEQMGKAVVGKREVLELVLLGILADGHVLIEDYPGLAKTLIARSFARCCGLRFARIQFTPDLMPSDITGSSIFNQRSGDFEMRPGPIFANLVLGDEINRSPAKTQAALLEGMQERQVTIEGVTWPLPRPFLVLATQNPIEYEGTYPLPEAQLDRFLLRVHIDPDIQFYIVDLVEATRRHPGVQVGASPRGSLALMKLSRARAAVAGRDFVTPEDVKSVAVPALAHRLSLRPELWVQRVRADDVIAECLASVATPPTRAPGRPEEKALR